MMKEICAICGKERDSEAKKCECGSLLFVEREYNEENAIFFKPLMSNEEAAKHIDFENFNIEDFEDDSLFEGDSFIKRK